MSATDETRGKSLTPLHRSEEVSQRSFRDGMISGCLTLIPSGGIVYYLHQHNEKFRKYTNFQAKTALVIMPALFMFGFTSESKLIGQMHDMAHEAEHTQQMTEWAARRHMLEEKIRKREETEGPGATVYTSLNDVERQRKFQELYRKSVMDSGVRVVDGDKLKLHHIAANFWQEHPFQILLGVGVPAVGMIFFRRQGSGNLMLSQKIMQTRVLGQFTVLVFLLTLMGFKEYMDSTGTFITEDEAERRVRDMMDAQKELQYRLAEGMVEQEHVKEAVSKMHKKKN